MIKQEKISSILKSKKVITEDISLNEVSSSDWLDNLKTKIKIKFPFLYVWLIKLVSPVYEVCSPSQFLSTYNLETDTVLNIGSGTFIYDKEIINLDIQNYKGVDIVGNLVDLDMGEGCVDAILNVAMLEHVSNPEEFVAKFHYILKKGGKAFVFIPFVQGYHASPDDFQRYTYEGIKYLFRDFHIESIFVGGPTSGFVWILQEWLALFFSFGSKKLYKLIFPLFYVLSPIKVLDCFMAKHPFARNIATGFTVVVRK